MCSLKPKSLKETLLSSRHQAAQVSQLRQESQETAVSANTEESFAMTDSVTRSNEDNEMAPFQAEKIGTADDEHVEPMIMPKSPTSNRSYSQGK